jgi:hypothetical protein
MNLAGVHVRKTQNQLEIGYCNSIETETPEADARLIAAAPELLEALIGILDMAKRGVIKHSDGGPISIGDVEAAIAKATGGAE